MEFPKILFPNSINLNNRLKDIYIREILPLICSSSDDGNYGSAATKDIEALQLLSRRIHFGKFVAEAKFKDPQWHHQYVSLIQNQDADGIMQLLTNRTVEEKLLVRVKRKALIYGQEIDDQSANDATDLKIPLQVVSDLYEKYIIPLTKDVEVAYLLRRLDWI